MPGGDNSDDGQTVWARGNAAAKPPEEEVKQQALVPAEEQKSPTRKGVSFAPSSSPRVDTGKRASNLTVDDTLHTPLRAESTRRDQKLDFRIRKEYTDLHPQVKSRMNNRKLETKGELMRVATHLMEAYGLSQVEVMNVCELNEKDMTLIQKKIAKESTLRTTRQNSLQSLRLSIQGSDVADGRRKSSIWETEVYPEVYEFAMIFKVGDPKEEVEYEENGEEQTTDQLNDYARKTYDTLRKIGPREEHIVPVPRDPNDPEKGVMNKSVWVGADFCVQSYKSKPRLNPDFEQPEDDETGEVLVDKDGNPKYLHDYIIALIGLTEEKLKQWATLQQADMLLNPDKAIQIGRECNFPLAHKTCAKGEKFGEHHKTIEYGKWNHCYAKYSEHADQDIYEKFQINPDLVGPDLESEENQTVFAKKIRLRMIYEKLVAEETLGGAEIPIDRLMHDSNHPLLALFPLHNETNRQWLDEKWLRKWNWENLLHPPLKDIRDYFNEPIGFYFGFMEHYIFWLFPLCIIGLIWQIFLFVTGDTEFKGMEIFMIFVIIWSVCFVDFWKRRQNYLAAQWGMHNFEQKAVSRPTFEGQWIVDEVTGEPIEEFPKEWARVKLCGGCSGLFMMIASVVAIVYTIMILRGAFTRRGDQVCWQLNTDGETCDLWECVDGQNLDGNRCETEGNGFTRKLEFKWAIILGVVNAIQIFIFNMIFASVSGSLNEWENHKTQQAFDDSLVLKSFVFKFVNAFISLYYIAFLQEVLYPNGNTNEEIISLLRTQLASLFITALVIQNFTEVMLPPLLAKAGRRYARWGVDDENDKYINAVKVSAAEQQYELQDYPNTLEDMAEIVIQYGYVTLFVMCLPLIPILALINNILEIKVDGVKLVRNCRRPLPFGSDGLGSWVLVLEFFSVISVLTNAGVYTYRTDLVQKIPGIGTTDIANKKNMIFFGVCTGLFIFMGLFKWLIRDVPLAVNRHLQRQEYIEDVLVKGQEYDPKRLEKLADLDAEIDSIQEATDYCCFGKFAVTKGEKCCRCIPILRITGDKTADWTDPTLGRADDLPVEVILPENHADYLEVTTALNHEGAKTAMDQDAKNALPVNMRTRAEWKKEGIASRPHRPTRIFDERLDATERKGTHLSDGYAVSRFMGKAKSTVGMGKKTKNTTSGKSTRSPRLEVAAALELHPIDGSPSPGLSPMPGGPVPVIETSM